MLEFVSTSQFNRYGFRSRLKDCEPSLVLYNYVTPMAVCVEALLKQLWMEYENITIVDKELEDLTLQYLLRDQGFAKWLNNQYSFSQSLLDELDVYIRKESNTFKHKLTDIPSRTIEEKKNRFKCFYVFLAQYYKKKTGKDAPSWSDAEYESLVQSETQKQNNRAARVLRLGGAI